MTRSVTLLVNPSAGRGRALGLVARVGGTLRNAGLQVRTLLSRDYAEAELMAAEAVREGVDILAVMGGDGMMHLGANAVARQHRHGVGRTVLGLIPAGTGNDLCRGVGLDPDEPMAAAEVIASGVSRRIDLVKVNDRYVGAVLATGFDALVNARTNAMSWPKGNARYLVATLAELRVFAPLRYRLVVDGVVRELDAMLVAIGNTTSYGGGMRICPDADPADGLLDVTIIHPVSRAKLLQLLPQMHSGRFARDPCVERLQAREIAVEGAGLVGYGDGELIASAPMQVSVVAAAVPIFTHAPV